MADSSSPGHAGWSLVIYDQTDSLQVAPITGSSLTIGRGLDNDIVLNDPEVSRRHLRLTRATDPLQGETTLFIEDLNTSKGTLINGEPLVEPRLLRPGDVINLGAVAIRVDGPLQGVAQARLKTETQPISNDLKIRAEEVGKAELVPSPPVVNRPQPHSQPSKSQLIWLIVVGTLVALVIATLGGLIGLNLFYSSKRPNVARLTPTEQPVRLDIPQVIIIQGPDSSVLANQTVTLQAMASDASGVTRMELWVNDRKVDEVASQIDQNALSMTAGFQWSSARPGSYSLQVRAYNQSGFVGIAPGTTLTVIAEADTPTPEPTSTFAPIPVPTVTPLPPTSTPTPTATATATSTPTATPTPVATRVATVSIPASPSLIINTSALNVRSGPGTQYEALGQITQDSRPEIIGQANIGQGDWWQIRAPALPGGTGWVSANPRFTTALNASNVPRVNPPPAPTATPTKTATPSLDGAPITAPTATPTTAVVIRAPAGKTLLIVSNRSLANQPARLTLSGGKSVGGGREIDPPPNSEIQIVLEPDFYRAVWSSPWKSFARGADFTAVPGKVMVMWIVPEEGRTDTEIYDELVVGGPSTLGVVNP
jgi:hypothetical protein